MTIAYITPGTLPNGMTKLLTTRVTLLDDGGIHDRAIHSIHKLKMSRSAGGGFEDDEAVNRTNEFRRPVLGRALRVGKKR